MGLVNTNNISVAWAIEQTENLGQELGLGVLPASPVWTRVQPDEISSFTSENSTTERNPISSDRQNREPILTDRDVTVEYSADLTLSSFEDHIEGFMFCRSSNYDLTFKRSDTTATGYTIAAATASQAGKLQYTLGGPVTLVNAVNYVNAANNGLKELEADVATTDTEIQVSGLVAEVAPSNARVDLAGIRAETGDLSINVTGSTATLTSGNNGAVNNIDFTTLGLTVGQFIHIGGVEASNQFSAGAGYGRIFEISPSSISLDKVSSTLATDTGAGETIDILYGNFIRNVDRSDPSFLERSYQFEGTYPGLGPNGETRYKYLSGAMASEVTFDFPGQDKATCSFSFECKGDGGFVGTQKTNADTPLLHSKERALSTSADFARLRIADLDDDGLTTDFDSVSFTINNNSSARKVLDNLGARFIQFGNNTPSFDATVLFTNEEVYNRVNNNSTVTADIFLKNDDGAILVDFPAVKLSGGSEGFTKNETVTIDLTGSAFRDSVLGISIGISTLSIAP